MKIDRIKLGFVRIPVTVALALLLASWPYRQESVEFVVEGKVHYPKRARFSESWSIEVGAFDKRRRRYYVSRDTYNHVAIGDGICLEFSVGVFGWDGPSIVRYPSLCNPVNRELEK